jgi:phospholipid transport system substrate-binding protein
MKRIDALLLAGLMAASTPVFAEAMEPPAVSARQVAEETLDAVLVVLNEPGTSEENRRDRIAAIAYEHFDFDTMSRLVIARPWRKFTKQERAQFIAEFKTHLARSYGRRLGRYEGIKLEVVGEVSEPRGDVTVKSRIVGGQFDGATMDYRSRAKEGEWRVIDVTIEGVSLVSNFRAQFRPILTQGGAPELLARLKDKNESLQDELTADAQE